MSNGGKEIPRRAYIIQVLSGWLGEIRDAQGELGESITINNINIETLICTGDYSCISHSREDVMGDRIDAGAGAVVVNRSSLKKAFNSARSKDEDFAGAIKRLSDIIEKSNNVEAADNFDAMTEELGREVPRKNVLKSYWTGIVAALPAASEAIDLGEKISRIFS